MGEKMHKITMQNYQLQTLQNAFEHFIIRCRVKNLSEETITSYRSKVAHFLIFISPDTAFLEIDEKTVEDFIIYLKTNTKASDITINSYLRSLRAFLYYCMEEEGLSRFKIHMIKAEKKLKETYTDQELEILLKKPDMKKCTFGEFKTWAFENFLLGTGCRISTALSVKIGDIDFAEGVISLKKTKNRKQQLIPLSHTLSDVLRAYLAVRGGSSDDYLFCTETGTKGDKSTWQKLVRRYNRKRGVEKTGCHLFRHTFAKHWILSGGDIFRLQKILGHSSIEVTKEYLSMFDADVMLDFERFNPLDQLNKKSERIRMKR